MVNDIYCVRGIVLGIGICFAVGGLVKGVKNYKKKQLY